MTLNFQIFKSSDTPKVFKKYNSRAITTHIYI